MVDASEVQTVFSAELKRAFAEIENLQEPLDKVEIPNPHNLADLWLLARKIGQIMGTLAAAGYAGYLPPASKMTLIASACSRNRGKSVHVLISNLQTIASLCRNCFEDEDPSAAVKKGLSEIEEKIDFCMKLAGLEDVPLPDPAGNPAENFSGNAEIKPVSLNRSASTPVQAAPAGSAVLDEDLMPFFMQESRDLLKDLETLGDGLKGTSIPDEVESGRLSEFAQKLNRLIGGTAAMGFGRFAPLSRKTSLLASKCAQTRDKTIRVLILNLNNVVSVLAEGFESVESLKAVEQKLPDIEKRIDICMASVDIAHPEIKTQDEIDLMLKPYGVDH